MDAKYMTMSMMVEASGLHRQTIGAALQCKELHGGQRKKRGTWLVERQCFDAWVRDDPCPHALSLAAA